MCQTRAVLPDSYSNILILIIYLICQTKKNICFQVGEYLQTNVPNVFAGGDIVNAPVYASDNKKAVIGHYGLAQQHGRIAAFNMLGQKVPLKAIPYFWTTLFGKGIRYCGHGRYILLFPPLLLLLLLWDRTSTCLMLFFFTDTMILCTKEW